MSEDIDDTTLANLHRPQDGATIRAAINELRNRGYSDHQIAASTALHVDYVRRVLGKRMADDDAQS
jgi:hypothetical protein